MREDFVWDGEKQQSWQPVDNQLSAVVNAMWPYACAYMCDNVDY